MLNTGILNDSSTGNVDRLAVLADTAGSPTNDPLYHIKAMPADRRGTISTAGWYTVEHSFQNIDNRLVTTVRLVSSSGTTVKSWTLDLFTADHGYANDSIPDKVGGNRYGWFTHVTVNGGLAIDDVQRIQYTDAVSEPSLDTVSYTIQKGDNYWKLEKQHCWTYGLIEKLNPGINPEKLKVGQVITVPDTVNCVSQKPVQTTQSSSNPSSNSSSDDASMTTDNSIAIPTTSQDQEAVSENEEVIPIKADTKNYLAILVAGGVGTGIVVTAGFVLYKRKNNHK